MARALLSALIVGGAAAVMAAPAMAQDPAPPPQVQPPAAPSQSLFARDRNVSVSERPHPGYDPTPVQLGGFTALPKLDAGIEYNDNIYATQNAKKSDEIWTVNPEVDLLSNWNRNALQAFVRSASRFYSNYSSESTTDYQLGAAGRLDVGNGQLAAGGDTGELTEPRTSPNASSSTKPVRYQQSDAFATGVQDFNRVRLTGRFDLQNLDYHNGSDALNHSVLEDDRDHTLYTYAGKAEYAVSPDTSVYVAASYNDHEYRLSPPVSPTNRNSRGEQVNGGASFDLTNVIRGDVQIGWMQQDFSSHTFQRYSGFSALGRVEWFPSQLTTVTLTGSRQIQDSAAFGAAVYVAGSGNVQIDHELLRNVILTGRVGYEDDAYQGTARDDKITSAYIGARYMMNRLVGFNVGYSYIDETSSGAARGPIFQDNRITAGTTLRF
jgi:hypothetical protein